MPPIYISYKQSSNQPVAERIHEHLQNTFGQDAIASAKTLPPGLDFAGYLEKVMDDTIVCPVIIGEDWASTQQLDNPDNFLRIELEKAINAPGIRIVPVLVNNATMPSAEQLPESLRGLARLSAIHIRDNHFKADMQTLIHHIQTMGIPVKRLQKQLLLVASLALILLAAMSLLFLSDFPVLPAEPTPIGGSGNIIFSRNEDEGDGDIVALNLETGEEFLLTSGDANDWFPSYSPDASQIAFTRSEDNSAEGAEIYVMDADGSNLRQLTKNDTRDVGPAWSPDGSQIAFASYRNEQAEIFVMDADGSNQRQLTSQNGSDVGPVWSPDGSQIVFVSYRDGNFEIYVMNADGSDETRITHAEGHDWFAEWSPDASQMLFTSFAPDNDAGEIYLMDSDGTNLINLTDNDANDTRPVWSPDGTQIVFHSDRNGNDEIYIMNADGSDVRRITNTPENEWFMQWKP